MVLNFGTLRGNSQGVLKFGVVLNLGPVLPECDVLTLNGSRNYGTLECYCWADTSTRQEKIFEGKHLYADITAVQSHTKTAMPEVPILLNNLRGESALSPWGSFIRSQMPYAVPSHGPMTAKGKVWHIFKALVPVGMGLDVRIKGTR